MVSFVVEFDIKAVEECLLFCMRHMMQKEAGLGRLVAVVLYFALQTLLAIFDSLKKRFVLLIYSFYDHDC
jgi:hypothetical protein